MSKDKKKRLSIYDLFGRSSSDNTTKSSTSSKSQTKTTPTNKASHVTNKKNNHRLTFTLPDETIVTKLDSKSIPNPTTRDKRSSMITSKPNTISTSSNFSNLAQKSQSPSTTPAVKDSTIPEITTNSRPGLEDRKISASSITSSVYPNSRNVSSSTIDFSRQTSSIYPASTYIKESSLKPKATIKRNDLMGRRKPPPVVMAVDTEIPETKKIAETDIITAKSPVETLNESFNGSIGSTDDEFTPLNLLPVQNSNGSGPLGVTKQFNPSQNINSVNVHPQSDDYEPPSFKPTNNDSANIHKHSRTLSSIEEITNALEMFQLEHERSFHQDMSHTTDTNADDTKDTYFSNTSGYLNTIDMNLSREIYGNENDSNNSDIENGDNVANTSSENHDDSIVIRVKDLPELREGQKLDEYIEELKTTAGVQLSSSSIPIDASDSNDFADLEKPVMRLDSSAVSSESEIFYDSNSRAATPLLETTTSFDPQLAHAETIQDEQAEQFEETDENKTPTENSRPFDFSSKGRADTLTGYPVVDDEPELDGTKDIVTDNDDIQSHTTTSLDEHEVPESLISDFNYEELSLNNDENVRYGDEPDLIGPINKSFDSFVKKVNTSDSVIRYDNSDSAPSDLEEGSVVKMDDGEWKRYNSATTTNFFSPIIERKSDDDNSLVIPLSGFEQHESEVVTPTDQNHPDILQNQLTPRRDFDLEDEMDNTSVGMPVKNESDISLNELYPQGDSDGSDGSVASGEYEESVASGDYDDSDQDDGEYDEQYGTDENGGAEYRYGTPHFDIGSVTDSTGDSHGLYHPDDNTGTVSNSVLEFSPKTQFSFESQQENNEHVTPELYRRSSLWSGRLQGDAGGDMDADVTGTPTNLNFGSPERLVITNQAGGSSAGSDHDAFVPVGWDDSNSHIFEGDYDNEHENDTEVPRVDESRKSTYDRRENPMIKPIEHSMIVTPAIPLHSSHTMRSRRPPPTYASAGRRSRGFSVGTTDPELFTSGIANNKVTPDTVNSKPIMAGQTLDQQTVAVDENENVSRKGEKCTYIENMRNAGKKTTIINKPSTQILPLSIRQNGTISHKKIPSVQLLNNTYKSKHIVMKPKTRMLASEIDDGELPDATLAHNMQKTKVPIHPDADVIAASEQFNKLAKRKSGNLARNTSIMSVRPHYGDGMRLFVTNPDSD